METTPEMARQVLRSWLATEVLTPQVTRNGWSGLASEKQGQQRNRDSALGDDPGLWAEPADDDPPPWPLRMAAEPRAELYAAAEFAFEDKPRQPRPWYLVVLGALPAQEAFIQLDAAFADEADEDETERRTQGHVIAACAVLDEWGVLVPDTLAVASFAWGLGHMLAGGAASELADWDTHEQDLKERFGSILTPMDAGGIPRSLTWRDLRAVSRELAEELALAPELWLVTPCAIRMMRENPPRAEILSSFLLPDLGRVLRMQIDSPKPRPRIWACARQPSPGMPLTTACSCRACCSRRCSPWAAGQVRGYTRSPCCSRPRSTPSSETSTSAASPR
jgi:hypothetical protein